MCRITDAVRLAIIRMVIRFNELPFATQLVLFIVPAVLIFVLGIYFGVFPKHQHPFVGPKPPQF
jgi:hypothetical protein